MSRVQLRRSDLMGLLWLMRTHGQSTFQFNLRVCLAFFANQFKQDPNIQCREWETSSVSLCSEVCSLWFWFSADSRLKGMKSNQDNFLSLSRAMPCPWVFDFKISDFRVAVMHAVFWAIIAWNRRWFRQAVFASSPWPGALSPATLQVFGFGQDHLIETKTMTKRCFLNRAILYCLAVGCCPRSQVEPRGAFKLFITMILFPFNVTCWSLSWLDFWGHLSTDLNGSSMTLSLSLAVIDMASQSRFAWQEPRRFCAMIHEPNGETLQDSTQSSRSSIKSMTKLTVYSLQWVYSVQAYLHIRIVGIDRIDSDLD